RHGHRAGARRRDLHRVDLRPARARPAGAAQLPELRPAGHPRHRRLLDGLHHRLQPLRRPSLRLDRPPDQTRLMALLEVHDLRTSFRTDDGVVKAPDGVSFGGDTGKTLGIVGESGCGKSVTCLTIMGLNNPRNTMTSGEAVFKGDNLIGMSMSRLRKLRGEEIAMIFQDPMTSLNPVHSIGKQLVETVLLHHDISRKEAKKRAIESLKEVGSPRAERRVG